MLLDVFFCHVMYLSRIQRRGLGGIAPLLFSGNCSINSDGKTVMQMR